MLLVAIWCKGHTYVNEIAVWSAVSSSRTMENTLPQDVTGPRRSTMSRLAHESRKCGSPSITLCSTLVSDADTNFRKDPPR